MDPYTKYSPIQPIQQHIPAGMGQGGIGRPSPYNQYPDAQNLVPYNDSGNSSNNSNIYGFNMINVDKLVTLLGSPDIMDPYYGGVIVWSKRTLKERGMKPMQRVEVMDEYAIGTFPVKHTAYITTWFSIKLTPQQHRNVCNKFNPLIIYDSLKKQVMIRSNNLGTNVALFILLSKYQAGNLGLSKICSHNLVKKYFIYGAGLDLYKLLRSYRVHET